MSRNVRYLLLVFFNCLCIVFFLIFNIDMLFGIAMLLWIDLIVYAVSKFNNFFYISYGKTNVGNLWIA